MCDDSVILGKKENWIDPAPSDTVREPVTVTAVSADGTYIEKLGQPYLQYGVQLQTGRLENALTDDYEILFEKAKESGFQTVVTNISWKDIEPWRGAYNLYSVQKILDFAEKYDLQLELLWYGVSTLGYVSNAPAYIQNMTDWQYGYDNDEILQREQKALTVLMNYLYDNDTNRRVSMLQIENEPDYAGLSDCEDAFLSHINQLGLTVKSSPYRVLTRVNFVAYADNALLEKCTALPGIDICGLDPYQNIIGYSQYDLERLKEIDGNIPHFAEAAGCMSNNSYMILSALSQKCGYYIYELMTYGTADHDLGIYRKNADINVWEKRDGTKEVTIFKDVEAQPESQTDDIIALNRVISALGTKIVTAADGSFRVSGDDGLLTVAGNSFSFTSDDGTNHGAVLFDGTYYYLFATESGSFTVNGSTCDASIGCFGGSGAWQETGKGSTAEIEQGKVYRIKL